MREDWIEVELGEVCNIYPGIGFPKSKQGKSDGEFPFYKVGDISKNFKSGYRKLTICDNYIDSGDIGNIKANLIPTNSVVFAKIGEALKLNRRCLTAVECLIDNNAIGLKAVDKLNDLYLFFFFLTIRLEDYSRATTVPSVRKTDIEEIAFPLAPLPIQRAIVSKIEALFSDLDNGIANFKKAQEQLKIYRQAVLKKAFEGKLSELGKVGLKDDRIIDVEKDEKTEILKSNNPKNPNSDNEEDNLPKGWKWVKLGEVCLKIQIGPFGSQLHQSDYINSGIPLINPTHIKSGKIVPDVSLTITPEKKEALPNYILEKGDVIMGRRGEMGRCALISSKEIGWFCGTGSLYFRPNQKRLYPKYLSILLSSQMIKTELTNQSKGTTMTNLNKKIVHDLIIPLPSTLIEQNQIVQEIESRLSVCDKMEQSISDSLEKAEALRQSILKKAFDGKLLSQAEIEQCKRAADYEPASELLKKIKAEKLAKEQEKKKVTTKKKSEK